MPSYTYTIDKNRGLIRESLVGTITTEFIAEAHKQLHSDKDFKEHYHILVDFRNCTMDMQPAETKKAAEIHDRMFEPTLAKTAILVDSPRVAAMVLLVTGNIKTRITECFSTEEAALAWLEATTQ